MKKSNILAATFSLVLAATSGASFAGNYVTHAPNKTVANTNASVHVISTQDLSTRPINQQNHQSHYGKVIYVKYGDTLSKIAARYGTTVQRLMYLNKLNAYQANHIKAGQKLRVA